uniref:SHSP domain-containing protein n=1 Tax=Elaeophora elaphi TaxID=1147741 RepID=A0A0R3RZJ5_9BILA
MSSTSAYNRTSSYNRTYEKRVIEQVPKITGIGSPLHVSSMGSPLHVSTSSYQVLPEDLKVSVANSYIIVEARHGEREDEFGLVERLLLRKFPLPPNVPADAVTSNLTADGHLSVTATAPRLKDDGTARTIPIKMVSNVVKTEIKPPNSTANE